MNFYSSYTNRIKQALQKEHVFESFSGDSLMKGHGTNPPSISGIQDEIKTFSLTPEASLQELGRVMHLNVPTKSKLGEHPDFVHLKGTTNHEYHYIVSAFIDIKGSTHLHKKYNLQTIYTITNTIQCAAIHTCTLFGGHIQRLQGDGVFVYFGGRGIEKSIAVQRAVTASSFFSHFVKNDLKELFEEEGVDDIYTRIGIDFGDDDKVMWANFGIGFCSELTTNSLHTSLAAKMQLYANSNGIVLGENVKSKLTLDASFYNLVRDSDGNIIKRYIYEDRDKNFYYSQYRFDWYKFLKTLPLIREDNGKLIGLTGQQLEDKRLEGLRERAKLISSGNAFTDKFGSIDQNPSGIKNQPHRFHFNEKYI